MAPERRPGLMPTSKRRGCSGWTSRSRGTADLRAMPPLAQAELHGPAHAHRHGTAVALGRGKTIAAHGGPRGGLQTVTGAVEGAGAGDAAVDAADALHPQISLRLGGGRPAPGPRGRGPRARRV